MAIRLPCSSQCVISEVWTAFQRPRSTEPVRLGRGRDQVGHDHDRDVFGDGQAVDPGTRRLGAGEARPLTATGVAGALFERERARLHDLDLDWTSVFAFEH